MWQQIVDIFVGPTAENVDCQSFLETIEAHGLDIVGDVDLQKAFQDSVIKTSKAFYKYLLRLRLVGYLKLTTPPDSIRPKEFTNIIKRLLEYSFGTQEHRRFRLHYVRMLCRSMIEYRTFLNDQHVQLTRLHDALKDHLRLEPSSALVFDGYTFETEKEMYDALTKITKDLKNDDFIMNFITSPATTSTHPEPTAPVRLNQMAFLPGKSRRSQNGYIVPVQNPEYGLPTGLLTKLPKELLPTIGKYIPSQNYEWAPEEDCEKFISKVPRDIIRNFQTMDDIGYKTFVESVRSSLRNIKSVASSLIIIGYYKDDTTPKLLNATHPIFTNPESLLTGQNDYESLKNTCGIFGELRRDLLAQRVKIYDMLRLLKRIAQGEQDASAPLPTMYLHCPIPVNRYENLSEIYNTVPVGHRGVFAGNALRFFTPMVEFDERALRSILPK